MNDLDERLRALSPSSSEPDPDLAGRAAGLRERAAKRRATRHRRRVVLAAVPVAALVVAGLVVSISGDDDTQSVATGPATTAAVSTTVASTTTHAVPPESQSFGGAEGLAISVTPSTGLKDGDLVDVHVDGFDELDSPILVMCAGDVTAETATTACDLRGLEQADYLVGGDGRLEANEIVTVRRFLRITRGAQDPNAPEPFDCATEPVGCVVAIGEQTLPTRGAFTPVSFDVEAEVPETTLEISPATGVHAFQDVALSAYGLRPNSTYSLRQCVVGSVGECDETVWPSARTQPDGSLAAKRPALPAMYGYQGRVDCTVQRCELRITDESGEAIAAAPFTFAGDVEAPMPRLEVSPSGPYVDDQRVTLTGEHFPPGIEIGDQIGQCPDGKDTSVEERCSYPALNSGVVAEDGTFSIELRLSAALLYTGPCNGTTGCHLGWVIPHGPTITKAPLDFG